MVAITFRSQDGQARTVEAALGQSLMSQAKAAGVGGIDADCGGAMVCGTCHVFVGEPWVSALPAPSAGEMALIEYGLHPRDNSRLSCQLVVTKAMAGMWVEVPPAQK